MSSKNATLKYQSECAIALAKIARLHAKVQSQGSRKADWGDVGDMVSLNAQLDEIAQRFVCDDETK